MGTHRVFAVIKNALFLETVRRVLNHPDLEWLGYTTDYASVQEKISEVHPDTVIIEAVPDSDFPAETLDYLLLGNPGMRVIRLSMEDNNLVLFRSEHREITQAEDLLNIVRNS